jgi:hypothetical protein
MHSPVAPRAKVKHKDNSLIALEANALRHLFPRPDAGRPGLGGVTPKMEQKVFARYRLPWSRRAEFKIDHLIPVELGGADTIDNLWPQSVRAKPYGADRKELLTEMLLARIRAGQMTLAQAQEQISRDWIDAFIDHLGMVYLK